MHVALNSSFAPASKRTMLFNNVTTCLTSPHDDTTPNNDNRIYAHIYTMSLTISWSTLARLNQNQSYIPLSPCVTRCSCFVLYPTAFTRCFKRPFVQFFIMDVELAYTEHFCLYSLYTRGYIITFALDTTVYITWKRDACLTNAMQVWDGRYCRCH